MLCFLRHDGGELLAVPIFRSCINSPTMPRRRMRRGLLLILWLAVWTASTSAQPPEAAASKAVLQQVADSPFLEENLRVLCDEIGGRMPGTPAMKQAVEWAVEAFRDAGVDRVQTEPFMMPNSWQEGATKIEVLAPVGFSVRGVSSAWSPPTPEGGVRAEVLDGGSGARGEILALGERARGKILLLRSEPVTTFGDLAVEQRKATIASREAAEVEAAGVVFMSTRPHGLLYRHINIVNGKLDRIPSGLVAREDALRILRLIEAGKKVVMYLSLPNATGGPFQARNVVAELRGSELPTEIVVVGAHLDSWDLGTGCLDNGVNVSLVIEIARSLVASGVRPRRTVRFVLFGAEEQGLVGSQAYVRDHGEELDSHVAVVVHDMGVGRMEGYSLGGRRDIERGLMRAMQPVAGRGANAHSYEAFFGSDHFDFLLEGVPALVAVQDTSEYVPTYHSSADTFDKVNLQDLRHQVSIAAVTVLNLANQTPRLGKRLSRREIKSLMRRTQLDDQLKFLGLWDDWKSGERGRRREE